jgi:peroxiredoxin
LFVVNHQPVDDSLRAYAKKNLGNAFPLLGDTDQAVSRAYGVTTDDAPSYAAGLTAGGTAVRNPRMRRWTFYIDQEGVVRHIDKDVDITKHGENIVKKVKELGWVKADK